MFWFQNLSQKMYYFGEDGMRLFPLEMKNYGFIPGLKKKNQVWLRKRPQFWLQMKRNKPKKTTKHMILPAQTYNKLLPEQKNSTYRGKLDNLCPPCYNILINRLSI